MTTANSCVALSVTFDICIQPLCPPDPVQATWEVLSFSAGSRDSSATAGWHKCSSGRYNQVARPQFLSDDGRSTLRSERGVTLLIRLVEGSPTPYSRVETTASWLHCMRTQRQQDGPAEWAFVSFTRFHQPYPLRWAQEVIRDQKECDTNDDPDGGLAHGNAAAPQARV